MTDCDYPKLIANLRYKAIPRAKWEELVGQYTALRARTEAAEAHAAELETQLEDSAYRKQMIASEDGSLASRAIRLASAEGCDGEPYDTLYELGRDMLKLEKWKAGFTEHDPCCYDASPEELVNIYRSGRAALRLRAQLDDYETRLSAVMPQDFKDWHQNSKLEHPEVAAHVITNLREHLHEANLTEDFLRAQLEAKDARIADLDAEKARLLDLLGDPVETCPNCDGETSLGKAADGRLISCERCGGDEDGLGRGWVLRDEVCAAQAKREAEKEAHP